MKKEYVNVNTNQLHDELISAGIIPKYVASLDDKTVIIFEDSVDLDLVDQIVTAHIPNLYPPINPTIEERVTATEKSVVTLQETIDVIFGGV